MVEIPPVSDCIWVLVSHGANMIGGVRIKGQKHGIDNTVVFLFFSGSFFLSLALPCRFKHNSL